MANLPQAPKFSELRRHLNKEEFRKQLIEQIIKDLGIDAIEIDYCSPEFFNLAGQILTKHFHKVIDNQPNTIAELAYRVDVSEVKIKQALNSSQAPTGEILARLVLEREMLKVFYRNVYNGNISL